MRHTVIWHPAALDQLAEIWTRASDRQAVTNAAGLIDEVLSVDPSVKGNDFYGDRILVEAPLAVTFTVRPDDRTVVILEVRHREVVVD